MWNLFKKLIFVGLTFSSQTVKADLSAIPFDQFSTAQGVITKIVATNAYSSNYWIITIRGFSTSAQAQAYAKTLPSLPLGALAYVQPVPYLLLKWDVLNYFGTNPYKLHYCSQTNWLEFMQYSGDKVIADILTRPTYGGGYWSWSDYSAKTGVGLPANLNSWCKKPYP